MHKMSFIQPLPESYLTRVRSLEGVKIATQNSWFGGIYQDDKNQLVTIAVDPETFLQVYPEYKLPDDQRAAWIADRTGVIVGTGIAQRFGWKIGDRIPIRSNIYTNKDGTQIWEMTVRGIYTASNGDVMSTYFHHEYFDEARTFGKGTIGWIIFRVDDPNRSTEIAAKVDAMFANSAAETKTATEKAFMQAWANQMGNIGALVTAVATAVFFTLLLVIANTMSQSVRERTNELAVMKTIGFSRNNVTGMVLAEALLLTFIGAGIGLVLANGCAVLISKSPLSQYFPSLGMPGSTFAIGVAIAVVLAALASALPATQAWQLRIVDALRRT
jgi:putative ABC transport system permease protein